MAFFVAFLRIVVDIMMTRLFTRAVIAVLGLIGVSTGIAGIVAFIAILAIVINPKTRKLWNLIREYAVHVACRIVNRIHPVPEQFYGPQWAKF